MKGFTLLEILVALTILSIATMVSLKCSSSMVHNVLGLKERSLAHWVAMNRAAEIKLDRQWIKLGMTTGEAEMAGQGWYWTVNTDKTADPVIRKANLTVSKDREKDEPLATLVIYIAQPKNDSTE